jgi:integrase
MPRRHANGEGTIYRRKDGHGRYEGAGYFLTTAGVRRRIRVYGKTRNEAHEKLTEAKARAQQGVPTPERSWRLGDYLDYWLEHVVQRNRRPTTQEQYEAAIRLYLKPGLGSYRLERLSVPLVQTFLNQHLTAGRSVRRVQIIRTVLSAALTRAQREELVTRNVARLVELPTYERNKVRPWSADEAKQFLGAAQADPLYPAFVLLVVYGLRRGEVLGLRWQDINFETADVRIRQQLVRVRSRLQPGPVKTKAGERDLPLVGLAREALELQQERQLSAYTDEGWAGARPGEGLERYSERLLVHCGRLHGCRYV